MLRPTSRTAAIIPAALKTKLYIHIIKQFIFKEQIPRAQVLATLKRASKSCLSSKERESIWEQAQTATHPPNNSGADFSNFTPTHNLEHYLNKISSAKNLIDLFGLVTESGNHIFLVEISLLLPPPTPEAARDYFCWVLEALRFDLARRMLQIKHYDLNQTDSEGNTVLHHYVRHRCKEQIAFLVSQPTIDPYRRNRLRHSPLSLAIDWAHQQNDFFMLDLFIKHIPNIVNQFMFDDITPLFYCIQSEHFKVGQYLLEHGANPNEKLISKNVNTSLLRLVLIRNHLDFARVLLRFGADINYYPDGIPMLAKAIDAGMNPLALFLIENGADINANVNSERPTSFYLLAYQSKNEIIMDALLRHGYRFQVTDMAAAIFRQDQHLLTRILAEQQSVLACHYLALLMCVDRVPGINVAMPFYTSALEQIRATINASPQLELKFLLFAESYLQDMRDSLQAILSIVDTEENDANDQRKSIIDKHDPSVQIDATLAAATASVSHTERENYIETILRKLSECKQKMQKLALDTHIPNKINTITRDFLEKCTLNQLQQIELVIDEWEQKTILRLAQELNQITTSEQAVTAPHLEPPVARKFHFMGTALTQLSHCYTIENSTRYTLLFQPTLIRDWDRATEQEQTRFSDLLSQLRFCTMRGSQGIKALRHQVPCEGTINQQPYKGCLTHEIKLQTFKHRIFLTTLFPEESGVNQQLLLLACLLRHGSDHDRRIPEPYRMGNVTLPVKAEPEVLRPSGP